MFLLVLRLVSVAILWFAVTDVGFDLLACRWLCSSACCSLRSFGSFHHSPDLRCSSRAVLVLLLFYFILLATSSVAVVPSLILTVGSLAVIPSVLLLPSHFVVVYDSVVRFWLLPTPQRSIAPLRD